MGKCFEYAKLGITMLMTCIVNALGGSDTILSLLVSLIVCDVITGVINAVITKTVSSTEMRNGIVRKLLIFVIIFIAFRVDICIIEANGEPISLFGKQLYLRTLFIVYACLEEAISLLENLANIGVPMPKWLRGILKQVSDCVNSSTPKAIIAWIKKCFGINICDKNSKEENKGVSDISEENKNSEDNS